MGRGSIGEEEGRVTEVALVTTWHRSEHVDPLGNPIWTFWIGISRPGPRKLDCLKAL